MKAIIFAIIAGLAWGIGEIFTKMVLHTGKIGPVTAIAVRSAVALPLLWIAYLIVVHGMRNEPRNWISAEPSILMKLILGSGVVAGALGMIFFYSALSVGEASKVKPIAFAIAPATAVILGWLMLGEQMTIQKALAVVLILTGVILLTGSPASPTALH